MSDGLVPLHPQGGAVEQFQPQPGLGPAPGGPNPGQGKNPLERPIAAIRRYKWLMVAIVTLSTLAGIAGLRFITAMFEVRAIVMLPPQTATGGDINGGPIRVTALLNSNASVELLTSYRVVDAVVRKLQLYLSMERPTVDAHLFKNLMVEDRFRAGEYELELDGAKQQWGLRLRGMTKNAEHGKITDSVGKSIGFRWLLPPTAIPRTGTEVIHFTVSTARERSLELIGRLVTARKPGSNFLWLTLQDADPKLAANIVNTWAEEYVRVAAELSKANMVEFSKTLDQQLKFSQASLEDASKALEDFKVHTITLPTEGGPVAAGIAETRDPVMKAFFEQKIQYENLKQDREDLERTMKAAAAGIVPYEAILQIPSVSGSRSAAALTKAFADRDATKSDLVTQRALYTDSVTIVRQLVDRLNTLERVTIPTLAAQMLTQLKDREDEFGRRIAGSSAELKAIPARTMQEMRLTRAVTTSAKLYEALKSRYAEAQLAEASATPDIRVLDPAVAPLAPMANTAPKLVAMSIAAGIGLAIALAILLDMIDTKFRYPDQATNELGLTIAGTVPKLPKGGVDPNSPEQVVQLVESFRSLRMHVMHSVSSPATLAVTSAASGDGKSLVSANLAMSFAEAGLRTILVDGDTRRGHLHEMFGAAVQPGLTEYLLGKGDVSAMIQGTSHPKLSILACGRRDRNSPELLSTVRLNTLVDVLRGSYDVVIFDTPPLAAGIDGYAISAATGNLLMVVRIGQTQRRLAAAKLAVAERLPIHVIGTVLNSVQLKGEFQYYGYAGGYSIEEPAGELAASSTG